MYIIVSIKWAHQLKMGAMLLWIVMGAVYVNANKSCGKSFFNTHRQPRLHHYHNEGSSGATFTENILFHSKISHQSSKWTERRLRLYLPPSVVTGADSDGWIAQSSKSRPLGRGQTPVKRSASISDRLRRAGSSRGQSVAGNRSRPNNRMMLFDKDVWSGRIVGGKKSKQGAWPWQVSLQLIHPRWGRIGHWCGGVLIDQLWVVTAAHCIKNKAFAFADSTALWQVVLGEHDRSVVEGNEVIMGADVIFTHDKYDNYQNDIALLKLDEPIKYTKHIQPICLPDTPGLRNESFIGIKCVSVGWGMRLHGAKLEDTLKEVWLPVVANSHCAKMYGMIHNVPVKNYHICAGDIGDGGVGTCIGDSGGPLQCNMMDGRWYLAGITSFGSGCAKPGFPDVFTRITYYLPWIKQKMRAY